MWDFRFLARRFLSLNLLWFLRINGSSFSTKIGRMTVCVVKMRLTLTVSNYFGYSFSRLSTKFKSV